MHMGFAVHATTYTKMDFAGLLLVLLLTSLKIDYKTYFFVLLLIISDFLAKPQMYSSRHHIHIIGQSK
jgi:hypothetical protein